MLKLFSMLSQTLAHLTDKVNLARGSSNLSTRVERLEKQYIQQIQENKKVDILNEQVIQLQRAVMELNAISNILLSVQQQLLEDLAYDAPSTSSRKSKSLIMMPFPGPDDDDLPN